MSLPRFSVRNSVLVNMIMILAIALGTYALITLPRELFPQVRLNRVMIMVPFPGASPEEVEKLITKPIEDEIKSLDHLDFYLSSSIEGQARLQVVFESVSDDEFQSVYQDLRREVDRVELPEEAKDPRYLSLESSTWMPMATVVISGDLPEKRLKELAEELEDAIEGMPGVDAVSLAGVRERQVWVELDPQKLYKHNLTLEQVSQRLRRQSVSKASGFFEIGDSEFLIRSVDEFESLDDIAEAVIKPDSVGNHLRVRDLGNVRDTFEEAVSLSRFNGKPSLSLSVFKAPDGNTLELIDSFHKLAEERERRLPPGVDIAVTGDNSERIVNAIHRLVSSGLFGGVLVLFLLLIFLGWRNALLVCWGIPITFLITFTFLEFFGESINESSLFALVLVLGMIVDDAIVVVENIARYLNRGMPTREAAIEGTREVMWPVISSSLTTIAAFLPLMLLPGAVGEFMKVIPIVVGFALAASLFESLVILPSHVAELGLSNPRGRKTKVNQVIRHASSRYRRVLSPLIRWRWVFLPVVFLLLASSFLVIPYVGVDLYEDDEFNVLFIRIWMPEGSRMAATDTVVKQFEDVALSLPEHEWIDVVAQLGRLDTDSDRLSGKDVAQVIVNLVEPKYRQRSIDDIIADLKDRSAHIYGHRRMEMTKVKTGPPVGRPIEVKIKGRYLETLTEISERIQAFLRELPGVYSVQDDLLKGKNEIRVNVDRNRSHLVGLDPSDVANQIKIAFDGIKSTVYHDGAEEIDVIVKFRPQSRRSLEDLHSLKIPAPSGGLVPLSNVARFGIERGWADINRFDGERAVTVSADVDESITSPIQAAQALVKEFGDIGQDYPGYRLDFRGEFQEFQEAFENIFRLFMVGVILMYLILAAQFRSYLQPALVLFAVPFAFAGSMLCLLVNGYQFSINVMFGMVALSGVAVNDSIVMISFMNDSRGRGASLYRAILHAAKRRLRPIFLTTITTVFGLMPMAMGVGGRSVTYSPLANTIVWGLGVATFLILMVMPPLYAALEDLRHLFRRRKPSATPQPVPIREAEQVRRAG